MSKLRPRPFKLVDIKGAEQLIGKHYPALRAVIESGWEAWEELGKRTPDLRSPLGGSVRARYIYDHIARRAETEFGGVKDVSLRKQRGYLVINFDSKLIVRFKKLDSRYRSRNPRTPTADKYFSQSRHCLPGMEDDATRLSAGYVLNRHGTALIDIGIACPNGPGDPFWKNSLFEHLAENTLPHPELKSDKETKRTRVRASAEATKRRGKKPGSRKAGS